MNKETRIRDFTHSNSVLYISGIVINGGDVGKKYFEGFIISVSSLIKFCQDRFPKTIEKYPDIDEFIGQGLKAFMISRFIEENNIDVLAS